MPTALAALRSEGMLKCASTNVQSRKSKSTPHPSRFLRRFLNLKMKTLSMRSSHLSEVTPRDFSIVAPLCPKHFLPAEKKVGEAHEEPCRRHRCSVLNAAKPCIARRRRGKILDLLSRLIVARRPTTSQPTVYFMLKPPHGTSADADSFWKSLLAHVAINGSAFQTNAGNDFGQAQDFDGVMFFGAGEERQITV